MTTGAASDDPTRIVLFGKPFPGLQAVAPKSAAGASAFQQALAKAAAAAAAAAAPKQKGGAAGCSVARIFSFAYEGRYYKLPWPMLFLVGGVGVAPGKTPSAAVTGIEGQDWTFSVDILAWSVDRYDIAICLDMLVGRYEDLLLGPDGLLQDDAAPRTAAISRSATAARTATAFRTAATARTAMIGPHQER
jgi:hypothetical protein